MVKRAANAFNVLVITPPKRMSCGRWSDIQLCIDGFIGVLLKLTRSYRGRAAIQQNCFK
jgi:hypothetical protein